jgi:glucokinase
MNTQYLCADIGATNARFAQIAIIDGVPRVLRRHDFSSVSHAHCTALILDALNALPGDYQGIALALPGPIIEDSCHVTLLPWVVRKVEIEHATGIKTFLLNDLEAQGWGIELLKDDELTPLRDGSLPTQGNRCIIAPGSDLGEAILYWNGENHQPFATEGGHCDFAPIDEFELKITALLQELYGHARWGDLVSGRAFVTLYRLLSDDSSCCLAGEDITERAVSGDIHAQEAVRRFLSLLGRESGNLALKAMATGGVYIAGGIVPTLDLELVKSEVVSAFNDKPSMASLLGRIPIFVVTATDLGVRGGARYIQKLS